MSIYRYTVCVYTVVLNKLLLLVRDYQGSVGWETQRLNYNRVRHQYLRGCI